MFRYKVEEVKPPKMKFDLVGIEPPSMAHAKTTKSNGTTYVSSPSIADELLLRSGATFALG